MIASKKRKTCCKMIIIILKKKARKGILDSFFFVIPPFKPRHSDNTVPNWKGKKDEASLRQHGIFHE